MIAHTFGTGFGETHTWHAPADADLNGDGRLDSVRLDFDGDGLADDAMIDADGDGVAEYAALDLDDDGTPDTYFTDTGNGVWGVRSPPPSGFGAVESGAPPKPGRQWRPVDLDGDGAPDATLVTFADGRRELHLDTDGDGRTDTVLVDSDGDGVVDRVRHRDP
ncbi:MAG TPA: hypothetical protein PK331_10010 [Gordonia sp. (in: high G+C Gram-positive bacteria)]|uniref:hypothetical protein n=1 Tax=unclassified Gordonia (in: high G+C Gram-positive bacteria) TaxID=2657482 RepID=UPI0025C4B669|nr:MULTISPECIES: hypothetical protein [unclassified Gordonia (in: high G+C Gram-positive bacteria)]HNP56419.1 hypothetical protein [Gordonia sp. (in: high G+C Gram-positive bacteria)]HRC51239.1 hypothetical protein [Gordonia sp. (in: high G+C Gram-positive bacteria)]